MTPTNTPTATPTNTPTATPTTTPTIVPPDGRVTITTILNNPPDTLSEYVAIKNISVPPVDMTAWTLRDLANNTYIFPNFSLAAGATVKIWTNSGPNDSANLYWGRSQAVWNNTSDTAILRDAQGTEIARYTYP